MPGSLHRPSVKGGVSLRIRCSWCWTGPLPCLHPQGAPDNGRVRVPGKSCPSLLSVTVHSCWKWGHSSHQAQVFFYPPLPPPTGCPVGAGCLHTMPTKAGAPRRQGSRSSGHRGCLGTHRAGCAYPTSTPAPPDSGLPSFEAKLLWVWGPAGPGIQC